MLDNTVKEKQRSEQVYFIEDSTSKVCSLPKMEKADRIVPVSSLTRIVDDLIGYRSVLP